MHVRHESPGSYWGAMKLERSAEQLAALDLRRLVEAGLVVARREGKFVYHTADCEAVHTLAKFLWVD